MQFVYIPYTTIHDGGLSNHYLARFRQLHFKLVENTISDPQVEIATLIEEFKHHAEIWKGSPDIATKTIIWRTRETLEESLRFEKGDQSIAAYKEILNHPAWQ